MKLIMHVNNVKKLEKQEKAKVEFMLLDYICDLSAREKCILFSQYEYISKYINNCMKLLNGWIKNDNSRKLNK